MLAFLIILGDVQVLEMGRAGSHISGIGGILIHEQKKNGKEGIGYSYYSPIIKINSSFSAYSRTDATCTDY